MKFIEAVGKTLDEAKQAALEQLGVDEQEIVFEVLRRPGAVAGLFRSGEYRVKAMLRSEIAEQTDQAKPAQLLDDEEPEEAASEQLASAQVTDQALPEPNQELSEDREEVLTRIAAKAQQTASDIVSLMGMDDVVVQVTSLEDQEIGLDITCQPPGLLIGRDGETLDALQMVVAIAANKGRSDGARIVLDAENYRERHTQKLADMARSYAAEAKESDREVVLPDLRAYERRIVHMTLRDDPEVETYSEGEGRDRVLVISPRT
jgi:spoIIIJ-associated protein